MADTGKGKGAGDDGAKAAAEKKAAEEKAAAEKAAAEKAAAEGKGDDDKKKERTFTEAEVKAREKAAAEKAAAEALKKAEEEKDLTELEKLKKENEDLRAANRLRDAKDSVVDALTKAGARSTELLWKAIKDDLEFDDKGNLKNLDTLVTTIKTDYADQFGEPKPSETIDGGAGGGEGTKGKLTKEALAKMSPAEIQKLDWETEVKPVMEAK